MKNDPLWAQFALEQIQLLYRIERQGEEKQLSKEQIEELRKKTAYPLLQDFEKWLDANYSQITCSAETMKRQDERQSYTPCWALAK